MPNEPLYYFGSFRLDPSNQQLWKGPDPVVLRRKTFGVLRYLVERPTELVSKDDLLESVWSDVVVSDTMPTICICELRKALGDDARVPRLIETVRGSGYRFIEKVDLAAPLAIDAQVELAARR